LDDTEGGVEHSVGRRVGRQKGGDIRYRGRTGELGREREHGGGRGRERGREMGRGRMGGARRGVLGRATKGGPGKKSRKRRRTKEDITYIPVEIDSPFFVYTR
jgi:hypothetical protein